METSWTNYKSQYEKSGSGIDKILYNGHYITDKSQICNVMNEYFCEWERNYKQKCRTVVVNS